jgi:hypothetical protein
MQTTYNVALTADEINALSAYVTNHLTIARASDATDVDADLESAADKLRWSAAFVNNPDEFAFEVNAIRND